MVQVKAEKTGAELNHSRPLNISTWSDYPEVNGFVDEIYKNHFSDLTQIKKKHLKVVLLDLYVCWFYDSDMCLAISLDNNAYKKNSIYNALFISNLTIKIVGRLKRDGFIYLKKGNNVVVARRTRIWPTGRLIELFQKAVFNILDIGLAPNTNTVILRNTDKEDIEYKSTAKTDAMREVLTDYNNLLHKTHIDIANVKKPEIVRKQGKDQKNPARIQINQHNKFVRRVFNETFERGGRFYGGFWQQVGKDHRKHIRLNGERVIEIDFSGWHIQLLYARKNINYYTKYGPGADPYDIHVPEINDPAYRRWLIKTLMLIAVNATTQAKTFMAMQHTDTPDDLNRPAGLVLSNELLGSILDKLKAKHAEIGEFFCTGAGIELQNVDGRITEQLIKTFTQSGVPILTVHDSYLVPEDYNRDLLAEMMKEYKAIGLGGKHLGGTGLASLETDLAYTRVKQLGYLDEEFDPEEPEGGELHQEILALREQELTATPAYKRRLSAFREWLERD